MSSFELIKNFSRIRGYMREFFVYGFRSREEMKGKSARSYDNERRRIESYLGDYVSFKRGAGGKNVFFSLDSRRIAHNPLYEAFKAKSFTARDITLHFILLDLLADGDALSVPEVADRIDADYLSRFEEPLSFDESTVRNKLKEYVTLGILQPEKDGKTLRYKMCKEDTSLAAWEDAIHFFTEENPLGVIGSFLIDRTETENEFFRFRNHFFLNACDSEITETLLEAIHTGYSIRIVLYSRAADEEHTHEVIPVKLLSGSGGRTFVACMGLDGKALIYRVDYIRKATLAKKIDDYVTTKARMEEVLSHTWGVSIGDGEHLEEISFDVHVEEGEAFIVSRLQREKRCGTVTKEDDDTWRFTANVYDSFELLPWIRTFTGRIMALRCDNEEVLRRLKEDYLAMAAQYGEGA